MRCPPSGLCLPCKLVEVHDGDTVKVSIPGSAFVWKIRLLDCWAPELSEKPEGPDAKDYLIKLLKGKDTLHCYIPAPSQVGEILKQIATFDRLLGHIFIDGENSVSELMVKSGHATKTKRDKAPD